MPILTNDAAQELLRGNHTGLLILIPGGVDCPGSASIAQMQRVQMGLHGCPVCMFYALQALYEKNPEFKKLVFDSLTKTI